MNIASTDIPGISGNSQLQGQRLAAIRAVLEALDADAFFLPRADEYLGEYIPSHNERLHWLTGFTGSAGMAVVLRDRAAIFVDGRYTVQVRGQVHGDYYAYEHLIESPPEDWLAARLPANSRVLIDPRMHTLRWYRQCVSKLEKADLEVLLTTTNPVDHCWEGRPEALMREALCLDEQFSGESSSSKRERIGKSIARAGADAALVFAPESVSWLLNVRGRDIPRQPVLQSFAVLEASGELHVAVDSRRIPAGITDHVGEGVSFVDETDAAALLSRWQGRRVLADPDTANAWTQLTLAESGAELVAAQDPVLLPKACKNPVEVAGAQAAHVRDGVAETRFLAWLDREVAAGRLHDEAALADQLEVFRSAGERFHEPSFDTISAAASNGAMCHYNHLDNEAATLARNNLYLVDSGGQYSDGTTDITRTVAIGEPSGRMRELFTLVLKGHIALATAVFPEGTTGTHLDVLARQFLWRHGFDYDHGTGHGVGSFLSVHEGPQRIAKAWNATALAPGMIVSNEPGYYRDGDFGIRCENLCVVQPWLDAPADADGPPMLHFETLTLAPFDRRLIDLSLLDDAELGWLNRYHQRVRNELSPALDAQDRQWLDEATATLR